MFSIAKYFGLEPDATGLSKNQMRMLAKGNVKLNQLASFTDSTLLEVQQAALKLKAPTPGSIYDDYVSFYRWRFCPICVREKRPHQKAWMICFITACTEHQCQLVDQCHACGTEYSTAHVLYRYCVVCQKPALETPAINEELRSAKLLTNLINNKHALGKTLDRLMMAWFLTNPNCLRPHYRMSPQLKTVSEIREIVCRLWPSCEDESIFSKALANYEFYLKKRWNQLHHLPEVFKERALSSGAKLSQAQRNNVETGFNLPQSLCWAPLNESARSAGISPFVLKRLVNKGYINSRIFNEKGPDKSRHKFLLIDLDSLNDVLNKLVDSSIPINGENNLTKILHYPLDEIVRDCFLGKLTLYHGKNKSLQDLWVVNIDTAKAKRREERHDDAMTSKEASRLLDTYHAVIVDLVKHDYLKLHHSSGNRRLLLTKESLENFKEKYIVVGAIAVEYGLNATNLAEKLSSIGVKPDSQKTLVNLYQRKKLVGITELTLNSISTYPAKTGRKPSFSEDLTKSDRVKKLIQLVNEYGGLSSFTRKFGGSMGTLSLMLQEKKSFGDLAMKRMENKVGLPRGWFES